MDESVKKLLKVLEVIRKYTDENVQLSQLDVLCYLLLHEGSGVEEIVKGIGMPDASVARHLKLLGKYLVRGAESGEKVYAGCDLIIPEVDIDAPRRKIYRLSIKGKQFKQELIDLLG